MVNLKLLRVLLFCTFYAGAIYLTKLLSSMDWKIFVAFTLGNFCAIAIEATRNRKKS